MIAPHRIDGCNNYINRDSALRIVAQIEAACPDMTTHTGRRLAEIFDLVTA